MIFAAGFATQAQEAVAQHAAAQESFEFVGDKVRQRCAGFGMPLLAKRLKVLAHQPVHYGRLRLPAGVTE
jgi:hypothetical protein